MNKKRALVFAAFLFISLIFISFLVSAQTEGVVKGVKDFFRPLLNALFGESQYIFEQLLFALVILAVSYFALAQTGIFNNYPFASWIISISVSILAVRFIATKGLTESLFFPSGVYGVALIVGIPFVLYFLFVEIALAGPQYRVLRRVMWCIYAAVHLILWFKYEIVPTNPNIPGASNFINDYSWSTLVSPPTLSPGLAVSDFGWIYLLAAGLAILIMLLDKTIQGAIYKSRRENIKGTYKEGIIIEKEAHLKKLYDLLGQATTDPERDRIQKQIDITEKNIKHLAG